MKARRFHVQLFIAGMLQNAKFPNDYKGVLAGHDNQPLPPKEAFDMMVTLLDAGTRFILIGTDPCEGWNPAGGCPGHDVADDEPEALHKIGDLVRVWRPGTPEHGLWCNVFHILTIAEFGGDARFGPHAYAPGSDGWHHVDYVGFFNVPLPDREVRSEQFYQEQLHTHRQGHTWRK